MRRKEKWEKNTKNRERMKIGWTSKREDSRETKKSWEEKREDKRQEQEELVRKRKNVTWCKEGDSRCRTNWNMNNEVGRGRGRRGYNRREGREMTIWRESLSEWHDINANNRLWTVASRFQIIYFLQLIALTSTLLIMSCCIVTDSTGYLPAALSADNITDGDRAEREKNKKMRDFQMLKWYRLR